MTAAYLWIIFPVFIAVLLWFIQKKQTVSLWIGISTCTILAGLASLVPVDQVINLGPINIEIASTWTILGRKFVLTNGDRSIMLMVYGFTAIYFLVGSQIRPHRYFIPIGLAMVAALVAALAVEPFLYAALLVETAVLLSIPILSPPGRQVSPGVLRYLIFQSLAMPFILLAGYTLGLAEANPSNFLFQSRSAILLGLGFAFWLAVFPFYTWVPLLSGECEPYPSGFVLILLPMIALLSGLDFINEFGWLRNNSLFPETLRFVGVLMVVTGGVWAAFQTNLLRMLGHAVIFETGFAMLALSLFNSSLDIYVASFLPRLFGLGGIFVSAAVMRKNGAKFDFSSLSGLIRMMPMVGISLLIAYFSVGGTPLLAGFPVRMALFEGLAQQSIGIAIWAAVGTVGFLAGGSRLIITLVRSEEADTNQRVETIPQAVLLGVGSIFILLLGLFPGYFLRGIIQLLSSYPNLIR